MFYPRLKTRPRSTHTVYRFGGLMHNDEAPVGMTNGTTMRWYDERNLGHDKAPMMAVKAPSTSAVSLDGNVGYARIIGWCDGDHPVLLDEMGVMWCNGHQFAVLQDLFPVYGGEWYTVEPAITATFGNVSVYSQQALVYLAYPDAQDFYLSRKTITIERIGGAWKYAGTEEYDPLWLKYGAGLQIDSGTPATGDTITVEFQPYYGLGGMRRLVRMGAYVIDPREKYYVNVEELAAGKTMVINENYGEMDASQLTDLSGNLTLTLCNIDGTPYTGAVASATEPVSHDNVWIDLSGSNTVVREWSASVSGWIVIPTTYVKLSPVHVAVASDYDSGVIATGDGVQFGAFEMDDSLDKDVKYLLNASHVIVKAEDENLGEGYVIVPGVLPSATVTLDQTHLSALQISRTVPRMDYMVEAQNRLWGCRYGQISSNPADAGTLINEIYCSKLGDPKNWNVYEGLSTDSWRASRGTPAPFTGAAVLSGHPLFFREDSLEKVYPSSAGAHQVQTFSLDGVEQGSADSLVVIDERLYYKSRLGICVYDGTMPRLISGAFGALRFTEGSAARHKKQYVIAMTAEDGERIAANYDTQSDEWHLETDGWDGTAITWKDELYTNGDPYAWRRYAYGDNRSVNWYAESGVIGYELAEHRFISCVRIRMKKHLNSMVKVYIRYQDTDWQQKAEITGAAFTDTREINIFPRRCDHFRIRLEGVGPCEILSMSYRMERSKGGH